MTTKTAALLISVCAAVLCLFSLIAPGDKFFYFISASGITDAFRLALAAWLVALTLKPSFIFKPSKNINLGLSALVAVFGFIGLVSTFLQNAIYTFFTPIDLLMMLGIGLLSASITLGLEPGTRPLPFSLPRVQLPHFGLRPINVRRQTRVSL